MIFINGIRYSENSKEKIEKVEKTEDKIFINGTLHSEKLKVRNEMNFIESGTYGDAWKNKDGNVVKIYHKNKKNVIDSSIISEIAILKLLSFNKVPNIIKLLDVSMNDDDIKITMEDGGEELHALYNYFKNNVPELIQVLFDILSTLRIFEDNKFIHFDLSPHNILYNIKTKKVSIIDFGGFIPELTTCKTFTHTLYFNEPRIDNKKSYKHDLYSLGCILIDIFYGTDCLVKLYNSKRFRKTFFLPYSENKSIELINLNNLIYKLIENINFRPSVESLMNFDMFSKCKSSYVPIKFKYFENIIGELSEYMDSVRKIIIEWFFDINTDENNRLTNIIPLAISIFDRYMFKNMNKIKKENFQLVSQASLSIADALLTKEDIDLEKLKINSVNIYNLEDIKNIIFSMLKDFDYLVFIPLPKTNLDDNNNVRNLITDLEFTKKYMKSFT